MNPFIILNLSPNASEKEIKHSYKYKLYRKLALKYHPDKSGLDPEYFHKLHEAYSQLLKPHERARLKEKFEKEAKVSDNLQKLRADLLSREKKSKEEVPKKRYREYEYEQTVKIVHGGIKLTWNSKNCYTEEMLAELFSKYGEIVKIKLKKDKAWVVFINQMSCVKDI